jgi:hypothetical protein
MHWVMHGERFGLICAELNCGDKNAAVKTATRRISCHISLNCSVGSWYTLTVPIFVMKRTVPGHTIDAI